MTEVGTAMIKRNLSSYDFPGDLKKKNYAESLVAVADIKLAVRSYKTGKSADFMKMAMASCDTLLRDRKSVV